MFYNTKQRGIVERMCQCFYTYSNPLDGEGHSPGTQRELDDSNDLTVMKPCGMFGDKTHPQVCEELKIKSAFKNVPG